MIVVTANRRRKASNWMLGDLLHQTAFHCILNIQAIGLYVAEVGVSIYDTLGIDSSRNQFSNLSNLAKVPHGWKSSDCNVPSVANRRNGSDGAQ